MLDKKTMYTIYLLHKVSELYSGTPRKDTCGGPCSTPSVEELRLRSYLSGTGSITQSLDTRSLVSLLNEAGRLIDPLPIPKECKAEIPRTLNQFNRGYKLWLTDIESSHSS